MAQEFDKLLPGLLQTTLSVSVGAAVKSLELLRDPEKGMNRVVSDMRDLLAIPADEVAPGLQDKAKTMAGVWLGKSAIIVHECKEAGEKFTEGK